MNIIIRQSCGCVVQNNPFDQLELLFCPLHNAAKQLGEAVAHSYRVFSAWEDEHPNKNLKVGECADLDAAKLMVKTTEDALRAADLY